MHATVVAERAGVHADRGKNQPAELMRCRRRAVEIEHAEWGVDGDDHLRLEAFDFVIDPAALGLGQGGFAGEAARVTAGGLGPVERRVFLPARRRKVAIEVYTVGIDALRLGCQQAIRIDGRHDAPREILRRRGLHPLHPLEHDGGGCQFVAMDTADEQDAHAMRVIGLGRIKSAHHDGLSARRIAAAWRQASFYARIR